MGGGLALPTPRLSQALLRNIERVLSMRAVPFGDTRAARLPTIWHYAAAGNSQIK